MTALLLFAFSASVLAAAAPIVIDGEFDDWAEVALALNDPADAPEAPLDFGELRVTHDDRFVHLLIDVTRTVNIQRLQGSIEVLFDADADDSTGGAVHGMKGVDLIVELSPRDPQKPNRGGLGAAISVPAFGPTGDRRRLNAYMIGLKVAPTYASDVFEVRIERGARLPRVPSLFRRVSFRCRLVYLDREGEILDDTLVFEYRGAAVKPVPRIQRTDPLARPTGTQLRVVTWNTSMDGLRNKPAHFKRVLHALDPDVLLLQELTEEDYPQNNEWTGLVGRGGGRLPCAIAVRGLPLERFAALDPLAMPDRPDRSVRVMGGELILAGRRLLLVSAHLRCCGYAGSFEDRTRVVEADAIRRAIDDAIASGRFDGVIVGGDLNLVGSRWPLDILADNLQVLDPLQLDGRSNTTWGDIRQPFIPGRLDFVLVNTTSLLVRRSFVLDTRLVSERWLRHHGLGTDDTAAASDHMPVVVDLSWKQAASPGR